MLAVNADGSFGFAQFGTSPASKGSTMTRKEVPAQAVNIKKAIASNTTCTSSTVSQLRSYLFPEPLAKTVANFTSIAVSRVPKSRGAQPKRDCRARSRKQPQVPIHEPPEVESIIVSDLDQAKLATDIINMVLRGLTDSVKVRSPAQEPCKEKRSTHTTNPNPTIVSPNGQRCAETPLRTLSINIVCAENGQCKEKRQPSRQSTCSDGAKAASGFAAQAECARLAFSALKTLDARGTLGKQLPFLQLENAMSTMVNKLVALGLFDPASRQLHALKQSLLDTVKGAEKAGSPPYEDTSNRERMTDLLVFPCADIKGPLLAMIATFQLQVLRLIAARPDSSLFEATYKHLQPSNPYSPVKLIQAQHDPADPGTSAKVANQLEALSRLVLSMSPATSSSEDHKSVHSKAIDPLTAFRLQNLGLELRSSWWSIAGHEGDIAKDILVPFSQHLSAFRRRCVTGYEEGYRSAKSALASLTLPGQCENQSTSATAVWSEAWLSISSEMVQLSRTICLPNEVRDWLAGCTKILVHKRMSACKRCALTCRKAVLYAQASTSLPNDGELVDALRDAEQHVEGSLDGSSEELDELLLVLSRLRNAAGIIVNKSRTPLQKLETPPAPDLIKQCYSICSTCVKFLNRYIGSRPSQNANHQLNRRYQQRLKQALAVATAFVDSVISIAQHIKGVDPDEWTRIDNGLQACIRLATLIQASHQEIAEDAANRNSSSNISISVSNTYWLRYSHLKQADGDRKEALKALKASVGAVEHRPLACKLAAHLQTRLEHYGNALEGAREFGKAVDIYQKSVRLYMETGVLQKAAETAATQSVSIAFARQGDTASLGRVLSACARVAIRTEEGISATYMISQDEPLEPMQRGMALEHQLATLVPMLEKGSIELLVKAINCLAKELLAIYSEDTFPIRRFRVIETLLWLQASRSDILSPELLDPVFMYSVNAIDGKTQRADLGLQLLVPHLNASRNSVLAIREECPTRKQQMLKTAICSWYLLVEQSHDLEALETRVGDPSFWLLHLELLAQYLEAYGLGLQRRSALQLLITLRERFFPTQHKELIFDLTQSGLQFLRLGYPHQAGLAFHRAQRYINKAEGIGEAAVRFFVGYAEYFLAVGSVSKCEENLAQARMIVMSSGGKQCLDMYSYNRTELPQLLAGVASLASDLAGKRGHPFTALLLARQSLNFVLKAWTDVERRQKRFQRDKGNIGGEVDVVGLVDSMSKMALPDHSTINNRPIVERKGSVHWRLVPQLHKAFLQVSRLCEKEGMFTEAQYFAARSEKLAETSSAYSLAVRSVSYLADLLARSGDYVEADSRFALASKQFLLLEEDQHFLEFQMDLMNHQLARGQTSAAEKTCLAVESTIRRLINPNLTQRTPHEQPDIIALQGQLSQMTVGTDESCPPGLEKRAPTRNTLKKSLPTARSARRDTASSLDEEVSSLALLHMRCRFSRQRIVLTIRQSKLDQARDFVVEATKKYFASEDSVLHAMLNAEIYVSRGLEALNSDPVYCVLQESTISLPSVTARKLSEPEAPLKASLAKAGRKPAKRGTVAADGKRVHADSQASTDYLGHELLQAHIETSKVYQLARTACSTATIHHLSKIMSENLLKLSALSIPIPQICFQARPCTLLGITGLSTSLTY